MKILPKGFIWRIWTAKGIIDTMDTAEKEIILNTYKWIKVPRYKDDSTLSWEERYKKLEEHHIEETQFLIDKVRELVLLID